MTILQIKLKNGNVKEYTYKNLTINELEAKVKKDNSGKCDYFNIKYANCVVQILRNEIEKITLRQIL